MLVRLTLTFAALSLVTLVSCATNGSALRDSTAFHCLMGSDGVQACGYHCRMGSDGAVACADAASGACAMGSNGRISCSRGTPSGSVPQASCQLGSDGRQACGYHCRLGSDGRAVCSSNPAQQCAMNADGTFICP